LGRDGHRPLLGHAVGVRGDDRDRAVRGQQPDVEAAADHRHLLAFDDDVGSVGGDGAEDDLLALGRADLLRQGERRTAEVDHEGAAHARRLERVARRRHLEHVLPRGEVLGPADVEGVLLRHSDRLAVDRHLDPTRARTADRGHDGQVRQAVAPDELAFLDAVDDEDRRGDGPVEDDPAGQEGERGHDDEPAQRHGEVPTTVAPVHGLPHCATPEPVRRERPDGRVPHRATSA
jgi:hypothetical protein